MAENLKPRDAAEVEQAIKWAIAGGKTLEIVGRGSKRLIGRAAQWDMTLDISGLSGVTLYEPAELVLSAKAGTPLSEIEALLAANGQQLAFEPMDYGPLLGGAGRQRHDRWGAFVESFGSAAHQGWRRPRPFSRRHARSPDAARSSNPAAGW